MTNAPASTTATTTATTTASTSAAPPRGQTIRPTVNPRRRTAAMALVNNFGEGLYMTVGVLFFTRTLGFGATRVGLVLSVGGLVGVLASVPAGRAADRWGIKPTLSALLLVESAGVAALAFCTRFAAFAVVACLVTAVDRGASAVRQALYARAFDPATRMADRAYIRAMTNVGIGLGAATASLALAADSRVGYQILIVLDAATFIAATALLGGIAQREAPPQRSDSEAESCKTKTKERAKTRTRTSRSYQAVSALNAILMIQFAVIEVGFPLWLIQDTRAPRALISGMFIVNTVLVVLFQVRATRGVVDSRSAARVVRRGALALAASCVVAATAHGTSAVDDTAILLSAMFLLSAGEVLSQAGAWALSFDLADERAVGTYQGVFSAGVAAGQMAGPVVLTQTALRHGFAGWLAIAALFAATGAAMVPTARWATAASHLRGDASHT